MLSRYTGPDRLIPVASRTINGLTIMQKVEVGIIQAGRESITCPLTVRQYAVGPGDTYGDEYPANLIAAYPKTIYANNLTATLADGSLAYTHLRGHVVRDYLAGGVEVEIPQVAGLSDEENFRTWLDGLPDTYHLQGEQFAQLQDLAPVPLWPLAVHHVQQADAMGYFA